MKSPKFHREIATKLTDFGLKRLVIQAPRGFAKSSLVAKIFVFWHLFVSDFALGRERRPKFIVLGSKSLYPHAVNLLDSIKNELNTNRIIREMWGDWGKRTARKWGAQEIILKDGTSIMARGASQMIVGLKRPSDKGDMRPTLFVWDDPEDDKNTKTPESMAANLRILLREVLPALCTEFGDKVVVIGTPVKEGCMVRKLAEMAEAASERSYDEDGNLEPQSGWVSMHYAGIIYPEGGNIEDGESLWPEKVPVEVMLTEKTNYEIALTPSVFYSEFMCEITYDSDLVFGRYGYYDGQIEYKNGNHFLKMTHRGAQTDNAKHRRESLSELEKEKIIPVNVFMGVDPASSVNTRADRTVICPIAIDAEGNRYMLPYFADRKKPLEVAREVIAAYERLRPLRTRIEDVAYQEMLRDYLRGKIVGVVGFKPRSAKNARLEGMQHLFGEGKMWIMPNMALFEQEAATYPNGKHDDTLDALWYAMLNIYPPMHTEESYVLGHKKKRRRRQEESWMARA